MRSALSLLVAGATVTLAAAAPQVGQELPTAAFDPRSCEPSRLHPPDQPYRLADVILAVVCQDLAVQQGLGLSIQAEAALLQARASSKPAVTANLRAGSADKDPLAADVSMRLEWMLYDFGSARSAVAQSKLGIRALQSERSAQALAAVSQAAQLHAAALSAYSRLQAAVANLRIAENSSRLAEARLSAGAANRGDRLQAETANAQARLERTRASTQWLNARSALASAMGLSPQTPVHLDSAESIELLERDTALDLEGLAAQARAEHPRVISALIRVSETRHRAESLKAERWGRVSLTASTSSARTLRDGSPANESSTSVGWSIPLLDRGIIQAQQLDLQGQTLLRDLALEEAKRQVDLGVWQAGQTLIGQRRSARAGRQVFDAATAALTAASERYRLGAGSFADLLNAQGAAALARLQLAEAQANLLEAHVRLAAAVGRLGPNFALLKELPR